jgi:phospholipid/cholesterol/gamma-HCH transport system substrate-binding protein
METSAPPISRIITMVLFALSCVGLLLFLWLSFGGTIPFNPKGYQVQVSFPNAGQLATQADVRIAGVTVGKVISKSLDPKGNRTIATLQIDRKYSPIRKNAQAILRMKTILGETYVQITPGTPNAPPVPDGGLLPRGQVVPAVQISEILNALDPTTRRAFQVWQQQLARAVHGNDQNLNSVLGNLPIFAADATDILRVLDVQHAAVVSLVQNGGTVFAALSRDQSALRNLITSAETTFHATASQNNQLAATFQVFPTFLNETKSTMARLQTFALNTDPLVKQLVPVAQDLGPTLQAVQRLSPDLENLFTNLGIDRPGRPSLVTVSKTGLPAVQKVLIGAKPLLASLGPFLEQLNPILTWLSLHQQLLSDFISNGAGPLSATTVSFCCNGTGHYLRQFSPIGPETLSLSPTRDPNNRGNTYPQPLWLSQIFNAGGRFPGDWGLFSWDCKNTGGEKPSLNVPLLGHQACVVQPPLPGDLGNPSKPAEPGKIPHLTPAQYSSK